MLLPKRELSTANQAAKQQRVQRVLFPGPRPEPLTVWGLFAAWPLMTYTAAGVPPHSPQRSTAAMAGRVPPRPREKDVGARRGWLRAFRCGC